MLPSGTLFRAPGVRRAGQGRRMRVVDLDRDMRDVIPTGATRDSTFLFDRMTEVTLSLLESRAGHRILDVASGFGQDAIVLEHGRGL